MRSPWIIISAIGFLLTMPFGFQLMEKIAYSKNFHLSPFVLFVTVLGFLLYFSGGYLAASQSRFRREKKVEFLEDRVRDNPKEPLAAWDLARVKLENYLDRNLNQVGLIFFLVISVMVVGFSLVSFGVWSAFVYPEKNSSSLASVGAGVFAQFIGATFLVIFKSTMAQAKDYVQVLERINAVGMSIQILESIEGESPSMRNKVRAELAGDLLRMYGKPGARRVNRSSIPK